MISNTGSPRACPFMEDLMKTALLLIVPVAFCAAQSPNNAANQHLIKEVRHELVMLPYVNIFDNLEFRVDGNNVTLMGQVTRPVIKSDAENVVKHVEGVGEVVNQIEVLPPSPADDAIRRATYTALVRQAPLQLYFMQSISPIRIVVKNGNVTLEGVVSTQADSDLAKIQANSVPGVFSVTNHLRVEK
jgi:hyperosmotically inducible protein